MKKDEKINEVAGTLAISSSCKISKIPVNGFVQYLYSPGVYLEIGDMVSNLVKVQFTCIPNHRTVGGDSIVCRNGTWDGNVPECESFCPVIQSSVAFSPHCTLNDAQVSCWDPPKAGTIATVTCRYGYEGVSGQKQQIICGSDGRWEPEPLPCTQMCGQRAEQNANAFQESDQSSLQAPWHVSVLKRTTIDDPFEPICGGSILNAKVVISATHCFWNEAISDIDDASLFQIRTGKYKYIRRNDGTTPADTFSIYNFNKFVEFNGLSSKYSGDVIVIILTSFIEFNFYTLPICIDYAWDREEGIISPGINGLMGFWGQNESLTEPSPTFKVGELTAVMREECVKNSLNDHINIFTTDKFCAKKLSPESAVCRGNNSGNGLIFPIKKNGTMKYFLKGVAAEKPTNVTNVAPCDLNDLNDFNNSIIYFSNIVYFSGYISTNDRDYKPIETVTLNVDESDVAKETKETISSTCLLNKIPTNGYAFYLNEELPIASESSFYNLGDDQTVSNNYIVRYGCNKNYLLKGKLTNVCLNGIWSGAAPVCSIDRGKIVNNHLISFNLLVTISKRRTNVKLQTIFSCDAKI